MTKRALLAIASQAAFVFTAFAQTSSCPAAPKNALSYELSPVHSQVKAGDKVLVHLVIKNVSSGTVPLWVEDASDPGGLNYQFEVRNSHGALAPEGHFSRALRGMKDPRLATRETPLKMSGRCTSLAAGGSRTYVVDVSRLYQMLIPGAYAIVAVNKQDAAHAVSISNVVTATVVPQ